MGRKGEEEGEFSSLIHLFQFESDYGKSFHKFSKSFGPHGFKFLVSSISFLSDRIQLLETNVMSLFLRRNTKRERESERERELVK